MPIPLVDLKAQYKTIKKEINKAIEKVLENCHFILGENVGKLEEEISNYCGTRYGIGVASGTDALLLSLLALGVGEGDEVITTPFTFIATTEAISKVRAKPVFVDINSKTYNLNIEQIEEKISPRTKAILPVHLYGQTCDMDPIMDLAKKYNLTVIEDAAQAIGAEYKRRKVGSIGDTGCFSFFPSKNLGAYGDGGMVVTDREEIAEKIRMLRVHGCKKKYYHQIDGYNSRLDELYAAILRIKLPHLDEWIKKRRQNAYYYNELFNSFNPVTVITPFEPDYSKHVHYLYTIRTQHRDVVQDALKSRGISTAVYYPVPLHLQNVYKGLGHKEGDFPISEQCSKEILSLPMYPELTKAQIEEIVKVIRALCKKINFLS